MLTACRVVLVEPMFGGNVGSTARAIKNTGLGPLHLVAPIYRDHEEAQRFGHGAEEVLTAARRHDTMLDAVADAQRVVGFTARQRHRRHSRPLRDFAEGWIRTADPEPMPTALVFGRERDGLTNEELDLCTDVVWIPSHPDHPSYNLSQAVLLCGYELLLAWTTLGEGAPRLHPRRTKGPPASPPATAEEIHALLDHLRRSFLSISYAYPHTVDPLIRSWAEVFARAKLLRREVAMIRGLAQQVLWAAGQLPAELRGGIDSADSASVEDHTDLGSDEEE